MRARAHTHTHTQVKKQELADYAQQWADQPILQDRLQMIGGGGHGGGGSFFFQGWNCMNKQLIAKVLFSRSLCVCVRARARARALPLCTHTHTHTHTQGWVESAKEGHFNVYKLTDAGLPVAAHLHSNIPPTNLTHTSSTATASCSSLCGGGGGGRVDSMNSAGRRELDEDSVGERARDNEVVGPNAHIHRDCFTPLRVTALLPCEFHTRLMYS